jgi:hypothetical protein
MKFDRVDTLSLGVEVMQHRRETVGQPGMIQEGAGAEVAAGLLQVGESPAGALARRGLLKRRIA